MPVQSGSETINMETKPGKLREHMNKNSIFLYNKYYCIIDISFLVHPQGGQEVLGILQVLSLTMNRAITLSDFSAIHLCFITYNKYLIQYQNRTENLVQNVRGMFFMTSSETSSCSQMSQKYNCFWCKLCK